MPAALYDYCRAGDYSPVKVGGGIVLPTDRQTQDYLLCELCEDVLNKGGETWLTPKLATIDRNFPFYDLLTKHVPDISEQGMAVYCAAKNPDIHVDKLTHFAMGIFWKASVHSWKGIGREPRIELGPYSEAIRQWLLGEKAFPEYVVLTMTVSSPHRAQITFNDPYEVREQDGRMYLTHVPGILFMLAIGKQIAQERNGLCLYRSPGHPIVMSEDLTNKLERMFAEMYLKSRKTDAFLKSKAKRDDALRQSSS
jgi:hypothetical protein